MQQDDEADGMWKLRTTKNILGTDRNKHGEELPSL